MSLDHTRGKGGSSLSLPIDRVPTWEEFCAAAERLAEPIWQGSDASGARAATNPGFLLKAAAAAGWDAIIPGSGYDHPPDEPAELVVIAGPGGMLKPPVVVSPSGNRPQDGKDVATTFLYLMDPSLPDLTYPREIAFSSGADVISFTTYREDTVEPTTPWGFPDFREPTRGWVGWVGTTLVVTYIRPGDQAIGCAEVQFEPTEDGTLDQAFWVAVARAGDLAEFY